MKESPIIWKNTELKQIFTDIGITVPADFINIESKENCLNLKQMRDHHDKSTGKITRRMTSLSVAGKVFFLKRAFGNALANIQNELEAIKMLPEFDLIPCGVAAHWFNDVSKEGFLLLENLDNFYSIKDIIKKLAPEDLQIYFAKNQENILRKVAEKIRKVHEKGFIYPDWFAKHLYIKKGSEEIALIDLERFRKIDNCPWYFSFPITSNFVKRKIFKKLRISLVRDSDCLTHKYLKVILNS